MSRAAEAKADGAVTGPRREAEGAEAAVLEVEPVNHSLDIRCAFCPGHSFRRSRLRGPDFKELLRFRYPVRCLNCSQRQLVGFTIAGISLASYAKHHRPMATFQAPLSGSEASVHPSAGKPPASAADVTRRDESAG